MTPVQELREAARLLRERSSAVPAGPWQSTGGFPAPSVRTELGSEVAYATHPEPSVTAYIAAMHPAVGLALAEVFDRVAFAVRLGDDLLNRVGYGEVLTAARIYLGRAS